MKYYLCEDCKQLITYGKKCQLCKIKNNIKNNVNKLNKNICDINIEYDNESEVYVAQLENIPEVMTQGETEKEVVDNLLDAYCAWKNYKINEWGK